MPLLSSPRSAWARKSIARVYIVMHQKQKENLRKFYKGKNDFGDRSSRQDERRSS